MNRIVLASGVIVSPITTIHANLFPFKALEGKRKKEAGRYQVQKNEEAGGCQREENVKAGLIGLGHLGRAMAIRLTAEGVDLTVWNRTLTKAEGLKVHMAPSPAALVSEVEVLFLNLFDSAAVREVLSGEDGVFKGVCADRVIVDTTT